MPNLNLIKNARKKKLNHFFFRKNSREKSFCSHVSNFRLPRPIDHSSTRLLNLISLNFRFLDCPAHYFKIWSTFQNNFLIKLWCIIAFDQKIRLTGVIKLIYWLGYFSFQLNWKDFFQVGGRIFVLETILFYLYASRN